MSKYSITASYSAEGLQGLQKDKASGRIRAATAAIEGLGGKVECLYFALGEDDIYGIVELPDHVTAAAAGIAASATGLIRTQTTVLMTAEEVDQALAKRVSYRAPDR